MKRGRVRAVLLVVGLIVVFVVVTYFANPSFLGTERVRPPSEVETINGVEFRHYFTEAAGVTWHHVESGAGQPILFVHGIPGAWVSWHHVMTALDGYRAIAVDLKGLGLTETPDGETEFSAEVVADEIAALMDALDIQTFALVSHEWGSVVASYFAARYPDRVTHFVRLTTPVSDAALNQIQTLITLPQIGATVLSDGEGFVRRMYTGAFSGLLMANVPGNVAVQPILETDVARIAQEFSYEGIPQAILRYYQETPADLRTNLAALASATTMPVLLLQGDADPIQPLSFYAAAAAAFPDARFETVAAAGHVPMLEQPAVLAEMIRQFVG